MSMARRVSYGWMIVITAFLVMFITSGVNFSYGVFFLPLIGEFGWSRGLASAAVLAAGLTYGITMPFTGIMADRYGYKWVLTVSIGFLSAGLILSSQIHELWQLYVFDGIFIGLSLSASFAIPVSLVSLWFARRQGLALGAATLGISLGTAVIPLIITFLISAFGWRTSILIAGIAVGVICIPAALLMRRPHAGEVQAAAPTKEVYAASEIPATQEPAGLSLSEALRTHQFWMLFSVFLFFLLGLGLVIVHIVPYAVDSGMPPLQAAALLTIIGMTGIAGRLGSGIISDRIGVKPVVLFCELILASLALWIAFSSTTVTFYAFAAIFGIVYSGFAVMLVRIARQIFGDRALGSVFGALMVADGIGTGAGPWLAGYIFDVTGSYQASFIAISAGLIVAVILTTLIKPAFRKAL